MSWDCCLQIGDSFSADILEVDEQLMRYQRIINDPVVDDPYSSAPITVKNYRVERWSWHTICEFIFEKSRLLLLTQISDGRQENGPLKFPGIDPEPEVLRVRH